MSRPHLTPVVAQLQLSDDVVVGIDEDAKDQTDGEDIDNGSALSHDDEDSRRFLLNVGMRL
jgi:hypothetical protein